VIIVARGGGSVEDLWAFNDETLARTAAASAIPLISAVGHETDTTLIDFVSDRRAPTPTAAAEMATPVLGELKAAVADYQQRLARGGSRLLEDRRNRLAAAARGLPRPADILALASQRFDLAAGRLGAALEKNASAHERDLTRWSARLNRTLLDRRFDTSAERVTALGARLQPAALRRLERSGDRLKSVERLMISLNPERPPKPGFVMVKRHDGSVVTSGAALASGEAVRLMFEDAPREAVIDGAKPAPRGKAPDAKQGSLF
jgi:exodeoxyribonuclease VII large subunit